MARRPEILLPRFRSAFRLPSKAPVSRLKPSDKENCVGGRMRSKDARRSVRFIGHQLAKSIFKVAIFLSSFLLVSSQSSHAIPAFARKYGLPCSACHIGWPILNVFGQQFRDNGYQLGNDRDAPIYQNNGYWPITFRVTPQWHLESQTKVAVDTTTPLGAEQTVTTHGFDLSGLDIWTAGTLYKNISFSVLPSMAEGDAFHFENAWVRFDNLLNSPWLNVKVGKFELDNLLSEKRFLTLSNVGGSWFNYHFTPQADN